MRLILRIIINAVALGVTAWIIPAFNIEGFGGLLLVAVVFGVVNAVIRPVVKFFSLPITCITLGLFTIVINAFMLLLTIWLANLIVPGSSVSISGNWFEQFMWAIVASIGISIVSGVLSWFLPDKND